MNMTISMNVQKKMFVNADFSEFNKKNNEQMFINIKRFSTSDFLLETNSEKLLKRTHDNDNDVFIIISAFN